MSTECPVSQTIAPRIASLVEERPTTVRHEAQEKTAGFVKYRRDIDGMRAVAVVAVIAFHAFPSSLKGGFIGVDIFFVISGFLISSILFSGLERNKFSFAEFYIRRAKRIFPSLSLMLIGCLVFGWFALLADEYRLLGKHVFAGAGFVSNWLLLSEKGYFDKASETKPLLHLWSLGIEEQFYLLWPFLLWVGRKIRLNLLVVIGAVLIASFVINVLYIRSDPVSMFYTPQSRFWELLIGATLAYLSLHHRGFFSSFNRVVQELLSGTGMALIVVGLVVLTSAHKFPGLWALLPTMGTALVIAAGPKAWLNRNILSNPVFVWIGLVSYPLYLWHWPLLCFPRIVYSSSTTLAEGPFEGAA
jgi:peptidoglycan/LPS O-acetylase OafA/YrhL